MIERAGLWGVVALAALLLPLRPGTARAAAVPKVPPTSTTTTDQRFQELENKLRGLLEDLAALREEVRAGKGGEAKVKSTPPVAVLYAPSLADVEGLVLSWKAGGRNLDPKPISLEWAPKRDGPWEIIGEEWLANTGKYVWKVPELMPPEVFLRLSVRDRAGKVAVAATPEPVVLYLRSLELLPVRLDERPR
jgi:hypothetical protein